jgi:hypothetical protein
MQCALPLSPEGAGGETKVRTVRGFGRTLLWRAAGPRAPPAFSGTSFGERLRSSLPVSSHARVAAVGAALLATAALLAAITLGSGALQSLLALPQGRIIAPADDRNFGWIERAIAQCEAEGARNADTLYFLVIPVLAAGGDPRAWAAKSNGTVGGSIMLLGSQDTLEGLRAGSLQLARATFNFSILDPPTSKVYQWRAALGVHKFAIRDAKTITVFRPGFEIPTGGETRWADGGAIPREAGTCYWTGALMPG